MQDNYYAGSFGRFLCKDENVFSYDLRNMRKERKKKKKKKKVVKKLKKFFFDIAYRVFGVVIDVAKEAAMAYVKHKLAIA